MRRLDAHGGLNAELRVTVRAAAYSVDVIDLPEELAAPGDPRREFVVADADGLRALSFAVPDRAFDHPVAEMTTQVTPEAGGARVTVTAHTLVRDLLAPGRPAAPGRPYRPRPGDAAHRRVGRVRRHRLGRGGHGDVAGTGIA